MKVASLKKVMHEINVIIDLMEVLQKFQAKRFKEDDFNQEEFITEALLVQQRSSLVDFGNINNYEEFYSAQSQEQLGNEFEKELNALYNKYYAEGLSKPMMLHKAEYSVVSLRLS